MGYENNHYDDQDAGSESNAHQDSGQDPQGKGRYRDEVFSKRVPAGKRTYFFDVKTTRSGEDYFITITESKRIDEGRYEKHKIFLYKEDFGKFVSAMHEVIGHIKTDLLPDYDFADLPALSTLLETEVKELVSEN